MNDINKSEPFIESLSLSTEQVKYRREVVDIFNNLPNNTFTEFYFDMPTVCLHFNCPRAGTDVV